MDKDVKDFSKNDWKIIRKLYDTNNDWNISDDEISKLVEDYNEQKLPSELREILDRFDVDKNGVLDSNEIINLKSMVQSVENNARYTGYTSSIARSLRYLAFSSEIGESLRYTISPKLVKTSYVVALSYCILDVGWEGFKASQENRFHLKNKSPQKAMFERAIFQLFASLVVPTIAINSSVSLIRKLLWKFPRGQRFLPTVAALSIIPFFPVYIDRPVENIIDMVLE